MKVTTNTTTASFLQVVCDQKRRLYRHIHILLQLVPVWKNKYIQEIKKTRNTQDLCTSNPILM